MKENTPLVDGTTFETSVAYWMRMGQLRLEKCELIEAMQAFESALTCAKEIQDTRSEIEALANLQRLASETRDFKKLKEISFVLDDVISQSKEIPAIAYYCQGAVAFHEQEYRKAQKFYVKFLRQLRLEDHGSLQFATWEEQEARGWCMLAGVFQAKGQFWRAKRVAEMMLRRYEGKELRSINALFYMILGQNEESLKNFEGAMHWYQRAHGGFLRVHNWYHYLYVLLAYARVARLRGQFDQAYFYLDLLDQAASGPEFGGLREHHGREKRLLSDDAVDIVIDRDRGVIRTRERGEVTLRKQFIIMEMIRALGEAHSNRSGGLSKAQLIQKVWGEKYRPEAHDNKLYYNINRLRKLIEPDASQPRYVQNWKSGYRLAPDLRLRDIQ